MRKQDDYRTMDEKIHDFVKKHKIIILVIGTLLDIILMVCSFLFDFKDACKAVLISYPITLVLFFIELKSDILTSVHAFRFGATFGFWILPFLFSIAMIYSNCNMG